MACTACTSLSGSRRSVSRVPGAPPRTAQDATAGSSNSATVTPEANRSSWAFPTVRPGTSVMRLRGPGMAGEKRSPESFTRSREPPQAIPVRQLDRPSVREDGAGRVSIRSKNALEVDDARCVASRRCAWRAYLLPQPVRAAAGAALSVVPRGNDLRPDGARRRQGDAAPRASLPSLLFVAGFSTVFVLLGATASLLGQFIRQYLTILSMVAGATIIIMGLHFLGVFRIGLLYREARVSVEDPSGSGAPT